MKRLFTLALIVLSTIGAAACTREKPPVTEPSPTALVSQNVTPAATTAPGGVVSTSVPGPTALATSSASETPGSTSLPTQAAIPTVALPTSAPTAAATEAPSVSTGPTTYTVQWGDWLSRIAARFGVSNQALLAANPGLNPNRIYPGQVLNIPAPGGAVPTVAPGGNPPPPSNIPSTYTVQRGDWFYAIARKFGVTVSSLQAANRSINPNFLYPGQVLNIPGGTGPGGDPSPGGSSYTVRAGDTLFSIAVRFGKTVYALQIANHLANPNFIYPGQALVIP